MQQMQGLSACVEVYHGHDAFMILFQVTLQITCDQNKVQERTITTWFWVCTSTIFSNLQLPGEHPGCHLQKRRRGVASLLFSSQVVFKGSANTKHTIKVPQVTVSLVFEFNLTTTKCDEKSGSLNSHLTTPEKAVTNVMPYLLHNIVWDKTIDLLHIWQMRC